MSNDYSIMVPAAGANFTAHTYTMVYAGVAATPTINNVAITMAAGTSFNLSIRSCSATAGVFLFGNNSSSYESAVLLG